MRRLDEIRAVCFVKQTKPHSKDEAPTIIQSEIAPTLNTFDVGDTRTNVFIVEPVFYNTQYESPQQSLFGDD